MTGIEPAPASAATIETDIPGRLDRLPWSRFHVLVILALGITWVLDGLEVTLAGSLSGALQSSPRLRLSDPEIGASASCYLAGAVSGAILFGWLTDRLGRRKLFNVTLSLYLLATAATAFSWNFGSFALFRCLTGAGIGGEYTAINSAIQELIPARFRAQTDLVVSGSFWLGAALGAAGGWQLLTPGRFDPDLGWRLAFGIGAGLGVGILFLRRFVPESPRWLMTHGRLADAEATTADIEDRVRRSAGPGLPAVTEPPLRLARSPAAIGPLALLVVLFGTYRRRAVVALVLMAAQAFLYNAIFFTYALVLGRFYRVEAAQIGLYLLPFAAGNFLGPVLLGRLFDTLGRRIMIASTYALSGLLLAATAWAFAHGLLDARALTSCWVGIFFFASAAASAAYLTVGESFPLEVRALAIAVFYSLGTGLGGIGGPLLFGTLIGTGDRVAIAWGYAAGSVLMIAAALVERCWGVDAERHGLERLAPPLSSHC